MRRFAALVVAASLVACSDQVKLNRQMRVVDDEVSIDSFDYRFMESIEQLPGEVLCPGVLAQRGDVALIDVRQYERAREKSFHDCRLATSDFAKIDSAQSPP